MRVYTPIFENKINEPRQRFPTMWYVRPAKAQTSLIRVFASMSMKLLTEHQMEFLMLGLHYVPGSTAVTVVRNVARRGVFSHFCLCVQVLLSLATFSHGLSRSAVTEARRRATVCRRWFYVSSRPATLCWDLSRFVTLRSSSATSIKFCQGFLR